MGRLTHWLFRVSVDHPKIELCTSTKRDRGRALSLVHAPPVDAQNVCKACEAIVKAEMPELL